MVRQAVRQAHGPERSRRTHHPEQSRRANPNDQNSTRRRRIKRFEHRWSREKSPNRHAGPGSVIPDLIRDQDEESGIQIILNLLDSDYRIKSGTSFAGMTCLDY